MQIALCEDNAAEAQMLQEYIETVMAEWGYTAQVVRFLNGEDLLHEIEKNIRFSILFLDIYMDALSGIDTACTVRERGENMPIIFVTTSREFAIEGFRLGAVHYIIKPITLDDVRQALGRCTEVLREQARRINVKMEDRTPRSILARDIHYAEIYDKRCILHLAGEDIATRLSLAELEEMLDGNENFIRCHRCYLVNLQHVRCIEGRDFVLHNGRRAMIAQRDTVRVRRIYGDYLFRKTRGGEK